MTRRRPLERAFAFLAGDLNCCRSDGDQVSDVRLTQLAATGQFPANENTFSASSIFRRAENLGGRKSRRCFLGIIILAQGKLRRGDAHEPQKTTMSISTQLFSSESQVRAPRWERFVVKRKRV